jgi:hypothetical protein
MTDKRLFIFVEGDDDQRFFSRVIRPVLAPRYASVELVRYACMKREKVCRFIRSVVAMNHDFIMVADIDQEPDVWAKKETIQHRFCAIERDNIAVIIMEIESWYMAGLDNPSAKALGVRPIRHTDHLTKELFNRRIPRRYHSRIAFMQVILDNFSPETALEKNRSFRYFARRFHIFQKKP